MGVCLLAMNKLVAVVARALCSALGCLEVAILSLPDVNVDDKIRCCSNGLLRMTLCLDWSIDLFMWTYWTGSPWFPASALRTE